MKLTGEFKKWLVGLRHDLHQHPEVALKEERTTRQILAHLKQMGIEAHGLSGMTGVVGLIPGAQEGPTLAIRADIDALPIQEMNQVPYKSTHPGMMHACGHDVHTAVLLGTARLVLESGLAGELRGNLKLIFQPAEETGVGARMMVERGSWKIPPWTASSPPTWPAICRSATWASTSARATPPTTFSACASRARAPTGPDPARATTRWWPGPI